MTDFLPTNKDTTTESNVSSILDSPKRVVVQKKICSSSVNKEEDDLYTATLKNALHQAIDENDLVHYPIISSYISKLRTRVMELEALLSAAHDEIQQKDQAILELADIIEVRL